MKKVQILLVLSFVFTAFINSYSQTGSALPFLLFNPSPSATAMGDVGVAYNSDEAFNISSNPAHLGAMGKDHNFIASTNLNHYYLFNSFNFGFQFGLDLNKLTGLPLHAGIGYLRQSENLGEFTRTSENGQVIGKFNSYENANSIAIGASLDYWVEISIGLTYKFISSNLTPTDLTELIDGPSRTGALDAGLLISIPILDNYNIFGDVKSDIKANIGYSILNMGNEIEYGREKDPLPLNDRIGYSIKADFKLPINKKDFSILKIDWTAETREFLVNRDSLSTSYANPFSRINLPDNLLLLNNNRNNIQIGYGMKLTAFDFFSYMSGHYENGIYKYSTDGFEISSKGIFNFLIDDSNTGTLGFIKKHFEISYSSAKITNDVREDIELNSISLKINNISF
jgi:hypothetical protein